MEEKKLAEYPQLLGVHNYPVIQEIDFLSESIKIKLDRHLAKLEVGDMIFNLARIGVSLKNQQSLFAFLVERGVVEKKMAVWCPRCHESTISEYFNVEEQVVFEQALRSDGDSPLLETLEDFCMSCEESWDREEVAKKPEYNIRYMMKVGRDTSLDDV